MLSPLKAWLWLTQQLEIGPAWQVLQYFGTPEKAYFADDGEYDLISGLNAVCRNKLKDKSLDAVEQILADCDEKQVQILTWQDTSYPERLRNIDLPPLVLYYRGTLPRFDEEIAIAMAGTRKATPYGRKAAAEIAFQITHLGGLVLTGAVGGCDRCALEGALKAGGSVVCIMAGGVDVPYYDNRSSREMLEDVAACGMLISEYPPGTPHLSGHFPERNRILTGLSLGAVCVEAPMRSGTLNVAHLALEQGRDVYAVPANIDAAGSAGTNHLLVQGEAICVCSGADVLEHYWALFPNKRRGEHTLTEQAVEQRIASVVDKDPAEEKIKEKKPETETVKPSEPEHRHIRLSEHRNEYTDDEQAILLALSREPMVTDSIVAETGLPARRVSAALTVLTIRGLIRSKPGGFFEATAIFIQ